MDINQPNNTNNTINNTNPNPNNNNNPSIVIVFIKVIRDNKDILFLTHQRAETKKIYPLLWGLGAGGKIDGDELPQVAAIRETQEELGLLVSNSTNDDDEFLGPICEFDFQDKFVHHHVLVFTVTLFGDHMLTKIQPCVREFKQIKWISLSELFQFEHDHQFCPDTLMAIKLVRNNSNFFIA
jgi:8-oxo-dGTP pyrophosphatase MutT (NUDIX family)